MKDGEKEIILDTNFDTNLEQDNKSTNLNSSKVSKYVEKNLKNFEIKCKGLKLIIYSKHCIILYRMREIHWSLRSHWIYAILSELSKQYKYCKKQYRNSDISNNVKTNKFSFNEDEAIAIIHQVILS